MKKTKTTKLTKQTIPGEFQIDIKTKDGEHTVRSFGVKEDIRKTFEELNSPDNPLEILDIRKV